MTGALFAALLFAMAEYDALSFEQTRLMAAAQTAYVKTSGLQLAQFATATERYLMTNPSTAPGTIICASTLLSTTTTQGYLPVGWSDTNDFGQQVEAEVLPDPINPASPTSTSALVGYLQQPDARMLSTLGMPDTGQATPQAAQSGLVLVERTAIQVDQDQRLNGNTVGTVAEYIGSPIGMYFYNPIDNTIAQGSSPFEYLTLPTTTQCGAPLGSNPGFYPSVTVTY